MALSKKRRRENTWMLPVDLMLEIVTRSNPHTLVRCAASCKLLRREILNLPFIRHISHQAAPCILAYLCNRSDKQPLTLVHPSTAVASSFCHDHLRRSMARKVGCLLDRYEIQTSRRGLILLISRNIKNRPNSRGCFDMCVYNSMSGARTFLSCPPDIKRTNNFYHKYVLLTAADGIGCSFMLLVAHLYGHNIKVQTASSCGTWGPVTHMRDDKFWWCLVKRYCDPAVLHGGVIHWLASYPENQILSYDLSTGKSGSVKLPSTNSDLNQLHLATSSDGKLLKLLTIEGFMISVWLQLPVSAAGGSGWSLHTVIDMEEKMRSLDPNITNCHNETIVFEGSGKTTGDVVLLEARRRRHGDALFVFDLETKEMHRQKWEYYTLLEIDLPSWLQTMKIFP